MTSVPNIENVDRILDATATAGQVDFNITWPVIADSEDAAVNDLVVLVDEVPLSASDFSFSGNVITGVPGVWNGGIVALVTPCTAGQRVIIYSDRAPRRVGSFLEGKSLPFSVLDTLQDDFAVQMRDMDLRVRRAITVPVDKFLDGMDSETLANEVLAAADTAENAEAGAVAAAAAAGSDLWSRPVISVLAIPPVGPSVGDRYLVAATGTTGAFVGFENQVAEWRGTSGWIFSGMPSPGQAVVDGPDIARYGFTGAGWRRKNATLDVGEFGATGDGTADDLAAIQAGIDWCQSKGLRILKGDLQYALSGTLDISNFGSSFQLELAGLVTHSSFPAPVSLLAATPMLRYGETGGSQVGLQTKLRYVDGGNKADIVSILNNGCGASTFDIDRIINANIGAKITANTWPTSNNLFRGGYWQQSKIGGYFKGGSQPCEGNVVDVNFIVNCIYGGLWLSDGAQYTNVRGQLDFNGTWLSELAVASIAGWAAGDTVTCAATGAVGVIHAVYITQGTPHLVVMETKDVSGGHSNFANGNTITNGAASTTISGVVTANESSSAFYFDIISAFTSSAPFSRLMISAPYLGGMVGGLTWTDSIRSGNSNFSFTNGEQGAMWTNSGTLLSLYDRRKSNASIVDISDTLFSIKRDVYLAGNGIYTNRVGLTLPNGVTTAVVTLPPAGANGACYDFNIVNPTDTAMRARATVTVAGSTAVLDSISLSNVTLSVSGLTVQAIQGTGSAKSMVCTWTMDTGP